MKESRAATYSSVISLFLLCLSTSVLGHGERAVARVVGGDGADNTEEDTQFDDVAASSPVIQAFVPGMDSTGGFDRATADLIAECMSAQGFDYEVSVDETEPPSASEFVTRDIGLREVDAAEQQGYTVGGVLGPELEAPDPAKLEPDYLAALFGPDHETPTVVEVTDPDTGEVVYLTTSPGGCVGQAAQAFGLHDEVERLSLLDQILFNMGRAALDDAVASPAFTNALEVWRACLAERGYGPFDSLAAPLYVSWPEPRPGAEEVAAAVADAECQAEADLHAIFLERLTMELAIADEDGAAVVAERNTLVRVVEQRAVDMLDDLD